MADRANNRSIIVYEPATQTVSIKKIMDLSKVTQFIFILFFFPSLVLHTELKRFVEKSPIIIQQAPKLKTHVDIINTESSEGPDTARPIAKLDLGKLGLTANAKRACGRLSQIYVMDDLDAPKSP